MERLYILYTDSSIKIEATYIFVNLNTVKCRNVWWLAKSESNDNFAGGCYIFLNRVCQDVHRICDTTHIVFRSNMWHKCFVVLVDCAHVFDCVECRHVNFSRSKKAKTVNFGLSILSADFNLLAEWNMLFCY